MQNESSARDGGSERPLGYAVLFLVAVLGCGCTIRIGGGFTEFEDNGTAGPGEAPQLPEPTVWHVPLPSLTPEQQQRQGEVDQFLAEQYRDYTIVEATQGYSGDIYYWVDSATMPYPSAVPPPPTWTQEDLLPPTGIEIAQTELELYPELRGPAGTTPIPRPDYSRYVIVSTGASSPQDYIENYQVSGMPSDQNRLYAGLHSFLPNMGVSGIVNQFQRDVEPGTFSLIELAVSCPTFGDVVEMVGVAVSLDRANPGSKDPAADGKPRLHIEYMTQGAGRMGDRIGGWDEQRAGFVPYPDRPYGPGGLVPASVLGGTQKESRIDIFQSASGDWWIAHAGNLLGHYPANLFKMLNGGACKATWYGEIYDPTPTTWTWTDMGSGQFASAGAPKAAYVRNPRFFDLLYNPWYPGDGPGLSVEPFNDACYTRSALLAGKPPWDRVLFLGGPGGDAEGCK